MRKPLMSHLSKWRRDGGRHILCAGRRDPWQRSIYAGLDRVAANPHLIVEIWAADGSGRAYIANDLPRVHEALRCQPIGYSGQVSVSRDNTSSVVDIDGQTIAPHRPDKSYLAATGGHYLTTNRGCKIDPAMQTHPTIDRMSSRPKAG